MKNIISIMMILYTCNTLAHNHPVEIELPKVANGDYQRPYVAVWISSKDNQSSQVLQLWHERERWLKDLKYFWRRILRKNPNSIDGVTGATRGPGHYKFNWDDENYAPGYYKLCAEAAREHGGRTAKCLMFELPLLKSQQIELDGEFTKLRIEAH